MNVVKGIKEFDRFKIHYRLYGACGPVIVCVNGAYQSMIVWRSMVKKFSGTYRVLTFDYPGQGRSEITAVPFCVDFDEQVRILAEMVTYAGNLDDVYLFGVSWGAVVSASYAVKYPDTIKKLILASFLAKPNHKLRTLIRQGQKFYQDGRYQDIAGLIVDGFGTGLPDFYKEHTREQFRSINDISLRAFNEYADWIHSFDNIRDYMDLRGIKAETLIVNSDKDPIVTVEDVKKAVEKIPQHTLKIVSEAGHFLHMENDGICDVYKSFIDDTSARKFNRYGAVYLGLKKKTAV
jgi:pimeloyl-ACP methyl ester carboxylesterase